MHQPVDRGSHFAFGLCGIDAGGTRDFIDEFARAVLQHLGGAIQHLTAIVSAGLAPAAGGGARGDDGIAEILARGVGEIIQLRAGRRFGGQSNVPGFSLRGNFPADEQLVEFF